MKLFFATSIFLISVENLIAEGTESSCSIPMICDGEPTWLDTNEMPYDPIQCLEDIERMKGDFEMMEANLEEMQSTLIHLRRQRGEFTTPVTKDAEKQAAEPHGLQFCQVITICEHKISWKNLTVYDPVTESAVTRCSHELGILAGRIQEIKTERDRLTEGLENERNLQRI